MGDLRVTLSSRWLKSYTRSETDHSLVRARDRESPARPTPRAPPLLPTPFLSCWQVSGGSGNSGESDASSACSGYGSESSFLTVDDDTDAGSVAGSDIDTERELDTDDEINQVAISPRPRPDLAPTSAPISALISP